MLKLCQKWSMWRNKIREMRGVLGKKTPWKEMDNPSFWWCHMDHFWHNFNTTWALSPYRFCKLEVSEKMSRVTSIDLSLFKGFPFPLLFSSLHFMTSHGWFFLTLCIAPAFVPSTRTNLNTLVKTHQKTNYRIVALWTKYLTFY